MTVLQAAADTQTAQGRLVKIRLESTDTTAHRVLGWVMLAVALTGIAIEAALGVRIWSQITGQASPGGLAGLAYGASGTLVGPFHGFEPTSEPIHTTSILEIASFVAMVAYLAATLVLLTVLVAARYAFSHLAARRMQSVWLPAPMAAHSGAVSAIKQPRLQPAASTPGLVPPARASSPANVTRDPIAADGATSSVAV